MPSFRIDRALRVTVIIAQHGRQELTERVLERVRTVEQTTVELLVVDDGSSDAVPDAWDRRFNVRILRQEHSGTTAAWNRGAGAATGDVLVFLNNDVEVRGPFLERLAAPLAENECLMTGVGFRRETSVPPELLTGKRTNVLEGWCLAVRARTFRDVGGFDPQFRLYFSDTDLQWRLLERERNSRSLCVVPDFPLSHAGHATTRRCPDRRAIWERDRAAFVRKWRAAAAEATGSRRCGPSFQLLQVCNAGTVLGGTGACAWTVTRALPDWRHSVMFLSAVDATTRDAFVPAKIFAGQSVDRKTISTIKPDLILMHNTPEARVGKQPLPAPCINYLHSRGTPYPADRIVCASEWLKDGHSRLKIAAVLYQGVPAPPRLDKLSPLRSLREEIIVGRLCTPTPRKWPVMLPDWYRKLAGAFPGIRWEFVGCPDGMQAELRRACGGRAVFHPAGISARAHLWNWNALVYHHPTLTESFGRTCAEAMRAGCIPVVDNRGGFREQIADGTGFLCGSDDEFQSALALLGDPGERMRRSRRCRAHADDTFGLRAFRAALLEEFGKLMT